MKISNKFSLSIVPQILGIQYDVFFNYLKQSGVLLDNEAIGFSYDELGYFKKKTRVYKIGGVVSQTEEVLVTKLGFKFLSDFCDHLKISVGK